MILENLALGLPTMLLCLILQAAATFWSVHYYVRRAGSREGIVAGMRPLLVAMLIMMLGNYLQILLWGALFLWLGEFAALYDAVYHSAVNFSSLGYGDIVMSRAWKLLGPLEAVNGILMLGLSGAALMAMLQQLIKGIRRQQGQALRFQSDRDASG